MPLFGNKNIAVEQEVIILKFLGKCSTRHHALKHWFVFD